MSLATRCTACGTVFRVVQDQLRVSEGWVRCGRCTEVFNAVENLVDPPLTAAAAVGAAGSGHPNTGSPGAMLRMGGSPVPAPAASTAGSGQNRSAPDPRADLPLEDGAQELPEWARSDLAPGRQAGPGVGQDNFQDELQDDRHENSDLVGAHDSTGHSPRDDISADPDDRYGASSLLPSGFQASGPPADATDVASAGQAPQSAPLRDRPQPSFVRRADRAARWQQPRVRRALAATAVLATLVLLGQAAHSYRDLLAARWPATRPLLAQACSALGCTVQAPRLIDALVVDSSGLLRVERSSVYRLSVTLRNQDLLDVALPALDLTLTDTQGRLVSRRVLNVQELGQPPNQTHLAAGAELLLQATLQTPEASAGQAVAGYTIELFYP